MAKIKLVPGQQRIFILLLTIASTVGWSLILPIHPLSPQASTEQTTDSDNAKPVNKQRVDNLRTTMLNSLQQQAEAKSLIYRVPTRFQGAVINAAKLNKDEKVIALTFDDGPWEGNTVKILDILEAEDVKATFFMVGRAIKAHPDLALRIASEGHALGNHTWNHWYHWFNQQAAAYEIERTSDLIYKTTGVKTTLFRPPGGMLHNGLAAYARNKKYTVIMWSADSVDYSRPAVPALVNNVLKSAKPGGIVLLHDGGGSRARTIEALPQIIAKLKAQGYRFVTVPQLLELKDKRLKPTPQLAQSQSKLLSKPKLSNKK